MPIPVADIVLAYRQAKVALLEERLSVGLVAIAEFEHNLDARLAALSRVLKAGGGFASTSLGSVWAAPKRISREAERRAAEVVSIVEPLRPIHLADVQLRFHLQPTVEFAIAEVLWIWRYGGALDSLLAPNCAANRIKRLRGGDLDRWARRLFQYWNEKYKDFQNQGIQAAVATLSRRGRCAFATFDIRSFYDNIDPSFLLSPNFVRSVAAFLRPEDVDSYSFDTHELLIKFAEYQTAVEQVTGVPMRGRGIPIGALSSRLVANLALGALDRRVVANRNVRHYARWVDDIIVVTDDVEAEDGIVAIANAVLPVSSEPGVSTLQLECVGLGCRNSVFEINRDKAKVYWLEGPAGLDFLAVIRADLDKIVSEQNAFIGGESRTEGTSNLLAMAGARGEDGPEAFQGLSEVKVRRFASSVLISKAIDSISLLSPGAVSQHRPLRSLVRVLAREKEWTSFLDLLLRVIEVASATPDPLLIDESLQLIDRWAREIEMFDAVPSWSGHAVPAHVLTRLSSFLHARASEAVARSIPLLEDDSPRPSRLNPLRIGSHETAYTSLLASARRLRQADLRLLDKETEAARGTPVEAHSPRAVLRSQIAAGSQLARRLAAIDVFIDASRQAGDAVYAGASSVDIFLMPRPPTLFDVSWRWARAYPNEPIAPVEVINAIRGTSYSGEMAALIRNDRGDARTIQFPPGRTSELSAPVRIVLANLLTRDSWFTAAARGTPIATRGRLRTFATVVDAARRLRRPGERLLILFPELSVPRRWLRALASRLASEQIAFVAGLEYDRAFATVANEAVAVLPGQFARAGVFIWRKVTPAVGEEASFLQREALGFCAPIHLPGDRVVSSAWGAFSVLICSELLEVDARARLPGRIDYVLVPSWNRDRFTFEYLAQAAVLDLHAYVAIANNAHYSDCRIRGPYREDYRRDVCRLVDRDVNGVISGVPEIAKLRAFQAQPFSSQPPSLNVVATSAAASLVRSGALVAAVEDIFKPTPPGFVYRRP
jgi:hypothetical protein